MAIILVNDKKTAQSLQDIELDYYNAMKNAGIIIDQDYEEFKGSSDYIFANLAAQKEAQNDAMTLQLDYKQESANRYQSQIISRPPVLHTQFQAFMSDNGYEASTKAITEEEAGQRLIAINYEQTPEDDAAIGRLLVDATHAAGTVMVGDIEVLVPLSNNQQITARWKAANQLTPNFKIDIQVDRNEEIPVDPIDDIVTLFLENFSNEMVIGADLVPEKLMNTTLLPWASEVLVSYDIAGGETWATGVYLSNYDDKMTATLDNANVNITYV